MMKIQKKLAVINDLSGYGRCSLTVALPVVSAMGVQCCPVPTSILSNHTGYPVYFFDDYTEKLPAYIGKWKELGLSFDGILTGFLGSAEQIEVVEDFLDCFTTHPSFREAPESGCTKVIIDPIMGDHGKVYSTLTPELCDRMKCLAARADVLTPNLTEACILTDTPYQPHFTQKELDTLFGRLATLCAGQIVLTGVDMGTYLANLVFDPDSGKFLTLRKKRVAAERCGTGDIFSAVVAAGILNGMSLKEAAQKAASFICLCLKETAGYDISESDGVVFEPFLKYLIQ
ncbi:MAG: pyridoxamine kinase [Lachnospiraceae bacterium]|nr:pyridoxamine kinase [Lachnospiraceae bacterium]